MFAKKFWIPVVLVLIGVAIASTFWGQHIASQEPTKVYKTTQASQPAASTTSAQQEVSEGGHFHADSTRHAYAHPPAEQEAVALTDASETWRNGVWYPENYTQADIQADLAGLPAPFRSEEYERRSLKYGVNSYIKKHREKYPDCTEQEVIVADAKDYTRWLAADIDYNKKFSELTDEFDRLMSEFDGLMEKYNRPLSELSKLSEAERQRGIKTLKAHMRTIEAHNEREDALIRSKPIKPKPRHTH